MHLPPAPRVRAGAARAGGLAERRRSGSTPRRSTPTCSGGRAPGYSYTRIDNPTVDAFADAVAALEHPGGEGIKAQAFASGMAAITATLLAFTGAGKHVVAPAGCYGGTWSLLRHTLSRFGVETTFVDGTDVDAYAGSAAAPDRGRVGGDAHEPHHGRGRPAAAGRARP